MDRKSSVDKYPLPSTSISKNRLYSDLISCLETARKMNKPGVSIQGSIQKLSKNLYWEVLFSTTQLDKCRKVSYIEYCRQGEWHPHLDSEGESSRIPFLLQLKIFNVDRLKLLCFKPGTNLW